MPVEESTSPDPGAAGVSLRAPVAPKVQDWPPETHELGRFKRARRAYGFDEAALVPGGVTINPADVELSPNLGTIRIHIAVLAAAMAGVSKVAVALTIVGRVRLWVVD